MKALDFNEMENVEGGAPWYVNCTGGALGMYLSGNVFYGAVVGGVWGAFGVLAAGCGIGILAGLSVNPDSQVQTSAIGTTTSGIRQFN